MSSQAAIRLTGTSYAVIGLVQLAGEATPYDLKGMVEASIANFWPVQHTTFYGEPDRLAKAGYLRLRQETGGRRRKVYKVTARGAKALAEWLADAEFSPPQLRDETTLRTFLGGDPIPLLEAQHEWHGGKLAELENYLEAVRVVNREDAPGVERALLAGILYHRAQLRTCTELIDSYRRSK
jgi:PadR family transcriptional regulator AphA